MTTSEDDSESGVSVAELAHMLKVAPADLSAFVAEHHRAVPSANGTLHVSRRDVRQLIERFAVRQGYAFRSFAIPEELRECRLPWAETLVEMYSDAISFPSSLSPAQGRFMKDLIGNLQPKRVVEIGCFTGVSTVWMAAGLEQNGNEGAIHSLDLFPDIRPDHHLPYRYLDDSLQYATDHVARAGLSHRVRFHKLNSVEIGKRISEIIPPPYDFVFIDGDHSFGGCLSDMTSFLPHLSVGGYIVLHDIYPSSDLSGPRDVLDCYVRRSRNLDLVEIDTSPDNFGLALIRKRRAVSAWTLRQRWHVLWRMLSNLLSAGCRRIGRKMGWVGEWKYGQLSINECLRDLKLMLRTWRQ